MQRNILFSVWLLLGTLTGATWSWSKDGFIDSILSEYRKFDHASRADTNNDGIITETEFMFSLHKQADTNGNNDNQVSRDEFIDYYGQVYNISSELATVMFDYLNDPNSSDNVITPADVSLSSFSGRDYATVGEYRDGLEKWLRQSADKLYTILMSPHRISMHKEPKMSYTTFVNSYDSNSDGIISLAEMNNELKRINPNQPVRRRDWVLHNVQRYSADPITSNLVFDYWDRDRDLKLSVHDLQLLSEDMDLNGDNSLGREEFVRFVERGNKLSKRVTGAPVSLLMIQCPEPWWSELGWSSPTVDATRAAMDFDDDTNGWINEADLRRWRDIFDDDDDGSVSKYEYNKYHWERYGVNATMASAMFALADVNADSKLDDQDWEFHFKDGLSLSFCDARRSILDLARMAELFHGMGEERDMREAMQKRLQDELSWYQNNRQPSSTNWYGSSAYGEGSSNRNQDLCGRTVTCYVGESTETWWQPEAWLWWGMKRGGWGLGQTQNPYMGSQMGGGSRPIGVGRNPLAGVGGGIPNPGMLGSSSTPMYGQTPWQSGDMRNMGPVGGLGSYPPRYKRSDGTESEDNISKSDRSMNNEESYFSTYHRLYTPYSDNDRDTHSYTSPDRHRYGQDRSGENQRLANENRYNPQTFSSDQNKNNPSFETVDSARGGYPNTKPGINTNTPGGGNNYDPNTQQQNMNGMVPPMPLFGYPVVLGFDPWLLAGVPNMGMFGRMRRQDEVEVTDQEELTQDDEELARDKRDATENTDHTKSPEMPSKNVENSTEEFEHGDDWGFMMPPPPHFGINPWQYWLAWMMESAMMDALHSGVWDSGNITDAENDTMSDALDQMWQELMASGEQSSTEEEDKTEDTETKQQRSTREATGNDAEDGGDVNIKEGTDDRGRRFSSTYGSTFQTPNWQYLWNYSPGRQYFAIIARYWPFMMRYWNGFNQWNNGRGMSNSFDDWNRQGSNFGNMNFRGKRSAGDANAEQPQQTEGTDAVRRDYSQDNKENSDKDQDSIWRSASNKYGSDKEWKQQMNSGTGQWNMGTNDRYGFSSNRWVNGKLPVTGQPSHINWWKNFYQQVGNNWKNTQPYGSQWGGASVPSSSWIDMNPVQNEMWNGIIPRTMLSSVMAGGPGWSQSPWGGNFGDGLGFGNPNMESMGMMFPWGNMPNYDTQWQGNFGGYPGNWFSPRDTSSRLKTFGDVWKMLYRRFARKASDEDVAMDGSETDIADGEARKKRDADEDTRDKRQGYDFMPNMMGNGFMSNMMRNGYMSNMMGNGYMSNMMGNGHMSNMMGNGFMSPQSLPSWMTWMFYPGCQIHWSSIRYQRQASENESTDNTERQKRDDKAQAGTDKRWDGWNTNDQYQNRYWMTPFWYSMCPLVWQSMQGYGMQETMYPYQYSYQQFRKKRDASAEADVESDSPTDGARGRRWDDPWWDMYNKDYNCAEWINAMPAWTPWQGWNKLRSGRDAVENTESSADEAKSTQPRSFRKKENRAVRCRSWYKNNYNNMYRPGQNQMMFGNSDRWSNQMFGNPDGWSNQWSGLPSWNFMRNIRTANEAESEDITESRNKRDTDDLSRFKRQWQWQNQQQRMSQSMFPYDQNSMSWYRMYSPSSMGSGWNNNYGYGGGFGRGFRAARQDGDQNEGKGERKKREAQDSERRKRFWDQRPNDYSYNWMDQNRWGGDGMGSSWYSGYPNKMNSGFSSFGNNMNPWFGGNGQDWMRRWRRGGNAGEEEKQMTAERQKRDSDNDARGKRMIDDWYRYMDNSRGNYFGSDFMGSPGMNSFSQSSYPQNWWDSNYWQYMRNRRSIKDKEQPQKVYTAKRFSQWDDFNPYSQMNGWEAYMQNSMYPFQGWENSWWQSQWFPWRNVRDIRNYNENEKVKRDVSENIRSKRQYGFQSPSAGYDPNQGSNFMPMYDTGNYPGYSMGNMNQWNRRPYSQGMNPWASMNQWDSMRYPRNEGNEYRAREKRDVKEDNRAKRWQGFGDFGWPSNYQQWQSSPGDFSNYGSNTMGYPQQGTYWPNADRYNMKNFMRYRRDAGRSDKDAANTRRTERQGGNPWQMNNQFYPYQFYYRWNNNQMPLGNMGNWGMGNYQRYQRDSEYKEQSRNKRDAEEAGRVERQGGFPWSSFSTWNPYNRFNSMNDNRMPQQSNWNNNMWYSMRYRREVDEQGKETARTERQSGFGFPEQMGYNQYYPNQFSNRWNYNWMPNLNMRNWGMDNYMRFPRDSEAEEQKRNKRDVKGTDRVERQGEFFWSPYSRWGFYGRFNGMNDNWMPQWNNWNDRNHNMWNSMRYRREAVGTGNEISRAARQSRYPWQMYNYQNYPNQFSYPQGQNWMSNWKMRNWDSWNDIRFQRDSEKDDQERQKRDVKGSDRVERQGQFPMSGYNQWNPYNRHSGMNNDWMPNRNNFNQFSYPQGNNWMPNWNMRNWDSWNGMRFQRDSEKDDQERQKRDVKGNDRVERQEQFPMSGYNQWNPYNRDSGMNNGWMPYGNNWNQFSYPQGNNWMPNWNMRNWDSWNDMRFQRDSEKGDQERQKSDVKGSDRVERQGQFPMSGYNQWNPYNRHSGMNNDWMPNRDNWNQFSYPQGNNWMSNWNMRNWDSWGNVRFQRDSKNKDKQRPRRDVKRNDRVERQEQFPWSGYSQGNPYNRQYGMNNDWMSQRNNFNQFSYPQGNNWMPNWNMRNWDSWNDMRFQRDSREDDQERQKRDVKRNDRVERQGQFPMSGYNQWNPYNRDSGVNNDWMPYRNYWNQFSYQQGNNWMPSWNMRNWDSWNDMRFPRDSEKDDQERQKRDVKGSDRVERQGQFPWSGYSQWNPYNRQYDMNNDWMPYRNKWNNMWYSSKRYRRAADRRDKDDTTKRDIEGAARTERQGWSPWQMNYEQYYPNQLSYGWGNNWMPHWNMGNWDSQNYMRFQRDSGEVDQQRHKREAKGSDRMVRQGGQWAMFNQQNPYSIFYGMNNDRMGNQWYPYNFDYSWGNRMMPYWNMWSDTRFQRDSEKGHQERTKREVKESDRVERQQEFPWSMFNQWNPYGRVQGMNNDWMSYSNPWQNNMWYSMRYRREAKENTKDETSKREVNAARTERQSWYPWMMYNYNGPFNDYYGWENNWNDNGNWWNMMDNGNMWNNMWNSMRFQRQSEANDGDSKNKGQSREKRQSTFSWISNRWNPNYNYNDQFSNWNPYENWWGNNMWNPMRNIRASETKDQERNKRDAGKSDKERRESPFSWSSFSSPYPYNSMSSWDNNWMGYPWTFGYQSHGGWNPTRFIRKSSADDVRSKRDVTDQAKRNVPWYQSYPNRQMWNWDQYNDYNNFNTFDYPGSYYMRNFPRYQRASDDDNGEGTIKRSAETEAKSEDKMKRQSWGYSGNWNQQHMNGYPFWSSGFHTGLCPQHSMYRQNFNRYSRNAGDLGTVQTTSDERSKRESSENIRPKREWYPYGNQQNMYSWNMPFTDSMSWYGTDPWNMNSWMSWRYPRNPDDDQNREKRDAETDVKSKRQGGWNNMYSSNWNDQTMNRNFQTWPYEMNNRYRTMTPFWSSMSPSSPSMGSSNFWNTFSNFYPLRFSRDSANEQSRTERDADGAEREKRQYGFGSMNQNSWNRFGNYFTRPFYNNYDSQFSGNQINPWYEGYNSMFYSRYPREYDAADTNKGDRTKRDTEASNEKEAASKEKRNLQWYPQSWSGSYQNYYPEWYQQSQYQYPMMYMSNMYNPYMSNWFLWYIMSMARNPWYNGYYWSLMRNLRGAENEGENNEEFTPERQKRDTESETVARRKRMMNWMGSGSGFGNEWNQGFMSMPYNYPWFGFQNFPQSWNFMNPWNYRMGQYNYRNSRQSNDGEDVVKDVKRDASPDTRRKRQVDNTMMYPNSWENSMQGGGQMYPGSYYNRQWWDPNSYNMQGGQWNFQPSADWNSRYSGSPSSYYKRDNGDTENLDDDATEVRKKREAAEHNPKNVKRNTWYDNSGYMMPYGRSRSMNPYQQSHNSNNPWFRPNSQYGYNMGNQMGYRGKRDATDTEIERTRRQWQNSGYMMPFWRSRSMNSYQQSPNSYNTWPSNQYWNNMGNQMGYRGKRDTTNAESERTKRQWQNSGLRDNNMMYPNNWGSHGSSGSMYPWMSGRMNQDNMGRNFNSMWGMQSQSQSSWQNPMSFRGKRSIGENNMMYPNNWGSYGRSGSMYPWMSGRMSQGDMGRDFNSMWGMQSQFQNSWQNPMSFRGKRSTGEEKERSKRMNQYTSMGNQGWTPYFSNLGQRFQNPANPDMNYNSNWYNDWTKWNSGNTWNMPWNSWNRNLRGVRNNDKGRDSNVQKRDTQDTNDREKRMYNMNQFPSMFSNMWYGMGRNNMFYPGYQNVWNQWSNMPRWGLGGMRFSRSDDASGVTKLEEKSQ